MKQLVSIVVPLLVQENNSMEEIPPVTLSFSLEKLKNIDVIWVMGISSSLPKWTENYPDSLTYRFEDKYFSGSDAFTRLLLSPQFYSRFDWCEFIFLLDSNTVVLKNELEYWCKQGYDFIQPSRLEGPGLLKSYFQRVIETDNNPVYQGFTSLRRVDRLTKTTSQKTAKALQYCNQSAKKPQNDWTFWESNTHPWKANIRIPTLVNRKRFGLFSDEIGQEDLEMRKSFVIADYNSAKWELTSI